MSDNVVYPWAEVFINGMSVGVHPVTVSASVSNDLPGRLNFGSGITQRTGVIEWDRVEGKRGLLLSPYRRSTPTFTLPTPGDRVVVKMGVQSESVRQFGLLNGVTVFTGKVDYSETASGGYPKTYIVDDIDRLNRVVYFQPYKHHMPPTADGEIGWYRHTGFTPDTILSWIAYKCGYHVAPLPIGKDVYLSAQLQGTTYATETYWGRIENSVLTRGDTFNLPGFTRTSRGLALSQGALDYGPGSRNAPARLVISGMVGAEHKARTVIYVRIKGHETHLRVIIGADRAVWAQVGETMLGWVRPDPDGFFSVAFTPNGRTVLEADGGGKKEVQHPAWATGAVEGISVDAEKGSALSSLNIVGTAASETKPLGLGFKQTAYIDAGYHYPLHISRSIKGEKAIDVLKEICEAICLICYLDGEGRLRIQYGRIAHGKPTQGTLTTKKQVKGFTIKDDSQLYTHNVYVKYQTVAGDFDAKAGGSSVTLYEYPDLQFDAEERKTEIIGPEDDEEWFEVDTQLTYSDLDDTARANFNRKIGSVFGYAVKTGKAGEATERWGGGTTRLREITPWAWELSMQPRHASSTHIPELDTVHPSMWGKPSITIRGGAYAKLIDALPYKAPGAGPETAADLVHEAGSWATDTRAADIGLYTAQLTRKALPVITGLEVFFDPTITVGTRWNLDLTDTAGVKLLVFILGVDHDPARDTTTLTVRALEDFTAWSWGALPENYRNFQAVQNAYSSYSTLLEGTEKDG